MQARWEAKTTAELLDELREHQHHSQRAIETYNHAVKSQTYRDIDLAEMRQELSEGGMILGMLKELIAERYMLEFENNKQSLKESLSPEDMASHLKSAETHLEQRDYHLVIAETNLILYSDPTNGMAYYQRGLALAAPQKYQLAVNDFSMAVQFQPDMADAYWSRSNAYARLHQVDLQMADLKHATQLPPQHARAYRQRGYAFYLLKQYEEALADFNESIRLNADDQGVYYERAGVYMEIGDYRRALADCEHLLQTQPDSDAAIHRIKQIKRMRAGG